jgi:TatD DNase family protein
MLIDAHSHVDRYDLVSEEGLQNALSEIIRHRIFTISNSMDLPSYKRNLEIGTMCEYVLPTFGVHPWLAHEYANLPDELMEAVEQSPMIGEIGLDHFFVEDASTYPCQRRVFEFFLDAARRQEKIVTLHTKGAEREVLELLDRYDIQRAIVHWYSGPLDVFRELMARGMYFTVGIEALHSDHVQRIARDLPSHLLLTETDNPGGPKDFIGGPGMPSLVKDVVHGLAEIRGTSYEAILQTVHNNLKKLMGGDPWLVEVYDFIREGWQD